MDNKCKEVKTKLKEKTTEYERVAKVAGQMFIYLKEFKRKKVKTLWRIKRKK